MIKQVNYYPPDKISYESRLHFSSYRNQVSPFFRDITKEIGREKVKTKQVILNKDRGEEGRIIDIDWEREINLKYIIKEDIPEIISFLPTEIGVAFMVDGDEKIGLDIRHEGFLFNGEKLVHASSNKGKVFEEDFLVFLEKSNYTGVIFFEIVAMSRFGKIRYCFSCKEFPCKLLEEGFDWNLNKFPNLKAFKLRNS